WAWTLAVTAMGYELHITRKENWFDDGPDISDDEWRRYVAQDPEMEIVGLAEASTPNGQTLRYESPLLARWRNGSSEAWFDFRHGRVIVKSPDEEMVAKMVRIARTLRARVQGDDGEFYDG